MFMTVVSCCPTVQRRVPDSSSIRMMNHGYTIVVCLAASLCCPAVSTPSFNLCKSGKGKLPESKRPLLCSI